MKLILISIFLMTPFCFAKSLPPIKATNITTGNVFEYDWSEAKKGTVLVFISSTCPCSNAHIGHLVDLTQANPDIKFIGIHSNANESLVESQKYFKSLNLPFPVIQDHEAEWADRLKAYRTPHAFLITPLGSLAYQGGITSSANPERADSFYLKVTLKKFVAGEKVENSRTRVLGCQIARK